MPELTMLNTEHENKNEKKPVNEYKMMKNEEIMNDENISLKFKKRNKLDDGTIVEERKKRKKDPAHEGKEVQEPAPQTPSQKPQAMQHACPMLAAPTNPPHDSQTPNKQQKGRINQEILLKGRKKDL